MLDYVLISTAAFALVCLTIGFFGQLTFNVIVSLWYQPCVSRSRTSITRWEFIETHTIFLMHFRLLSISHCLMIWIVLTSRVMQSKPGRPVHQLCTRHMRPCQSCRDDVKLVGWPRNCVVCPWKNMMLGFASVMMRSNTPMVDRSFHRSYELWCGD